MRALPTVNIRGIARPLLGSLAIFIAMAMLSMTMMRPTSAAGSKDEDAVQTPQVTIPANAPSLGAIPDGTGAAGVCGANRDVTFTNAAALSPLTNVEVSVTGTHSWVGDLEASLISPAGVATHLLFSRTGAATAASFGDDSDFGGPYNFKDSAAGTHWWTAAAAAGGAAPVASADYRTVAAGPSAAPPAQTVMTATFAPLTCAQVVGTWTLRVRDCGASDTGSITAAALTLVGPACVTSTQHIVDFDGDGRTDPAVVRNTGGGPGGQITWFIQNSSGAPASTTTPWGISTDFFTPEDFDGDNKTDIAVWRPGAPFNSFFYILQSATSTLRTDVFGQSGDDPTMVGDYDGDGKADPAVYRSGLAAGDHSFWYYRSSINNQILGTEWGQNGDFPAPGDYDGDGKFDYVVQRNGGGGQARFFLLQTTAGVTSLIFGTPTDVIVPGDYDGDGKYDIATIRGSGGNILWNILNSNGGTTSSFTFGNSATDFGTQGDWDGDGKTDAAVWRPNADPTQNFFFIHRSTGSDATVEWGLNGDYPVANYNSH